LIISVTASCNFSLFETCDACSSWWRMKHSVWS
jgi:hypothetical protein